MDFKIINNIGQYVKTCDYILNPAVQQFFTCVGQDSILIHESRTLGTDGMLFFLFMLQICPNYFFLTKISKFKN